MRSLIKSRQWRLVASEVSLRPQTRQPPPTESSRIHKPKTHKHLKGQARDAPSPSHQIGSRKFAMRSVDPFLLPFKVSHFANSTPRSQSVYSWTWPKEIFPSSVRMHSQMERKSLSQSESTRWLFTLTHCLTVSVSCVSSKTAWSNEDG